MDIGNGHIFDGMFGIERETLRAAADGTLAKTPHPFADNKYLDRDFGENQLELITPPCGSIRSLMLTLDSLDRTARETLSLSGEYLWMNSNPPHIESDSDIRAAEFSGSLAFKNRYRKRLEKRYGKRLMLYSGIHFNFSFSERYLHDLHDGLGKYTDFKNELYLRLAKQVSRCSWLLVLLTAASPVYDLSLDGDGLSGTGFDGCASRRSGEKGYWNSFVPVLDYSSLDAYISSVNRYVHDGRLLAASELYLPVRLKAGGSKELESLKTEGINHIELRMFDLNPLSRLGVFAQDLEFAHYFLIYLTQLPDFDYTPDMQAAAVKNHKAAARYEMGDIRINGCAGYDAALGLLSDMKEYFKDYANVIKNIEHQEKKITEDDRYCRRVYRLLGEDFQGEMLRIAKKESDRNV